MDESSLREVARDGLRAQPEAEDLAKWCQEYAKAAADFRYFVLAEVFDEVSRHWEQALSVEVLDEINRLLADDVPSIVDSDIEVGSHLAVQLQIAVRAQLVRWTEWLGEARIRKLE